jgi:hypothetical protein
VFSCIAALRADMLRHGAMWYRDVRRGALQRSTTLVRGALRNAISMRANACRIIVRAMLHTLLARSRSAFSRAIFCADFFETHRKRVAIFLGMRTNTQHVFHNLECTFA